MAFLKEKFYRKPISLRDIAPAYHFFNFFRIGSGLKNTP
jgi:hypothetical protein